MDLHPSGRPLVISALPANNVRMKRYFFEQRGARDAEKSTRLIALTHMRPTVDKWIFAGRSKKPKNTSPELQTILDTLDPLTEEEIYRGYVVAAVRIRDVSFQEACVLRDTLCPSVHISPNALQILHYEKIVPIVPVRVTYNPKKRYDRTLPMTPELQALCHAVMRH